MGSHRYVLMERIGAGRMAEVFRAVARGAEGFERPVAIKRILPTLSQNHEFVRVVVHEANIATQLQHPNIAQILDLGREDGEYFIAMEFVHGRDLRGLLTTLRERRTGVPLKVALHIACKICEGLHYAHFATGQAGQPLSVIHRDVSPQNVLLSFDGEVKVTDFGLARAAERATETQRGTLREKLAYVAPEVLNGQTADRRSDIFGLGALLWEMLAGRALFMGADHHQTVQRVRAGSIPPLQAFDPSIPPPVERMVLRALERNRDARYATAEEFHSVLVEYANEYAFMTTGGLARWLAELEPRVATPQPAAASPDRQTREIRLDRLDHRGPVGLAAAHPLAPPAPLQPPSDRVTRVVVAPSGEVGIPEDTILASAGQAHAADARVVGRDLTPAMTAGESADPFADGTDPLSDIEPETEQRYDQDLALQTVRAPFHDETPSWDDDATEVWPDGVPPQRNDS